jgi:hypothetical protein
MSPSSPGSYLFLSAQVPPTVETLPCTHMFDMHEHACTHTHVHTHTHPPLHTAFFFLSPGFYFETSYALWTLSSASASKGADKFIPYPPKSQTIFLQI